MTTTIAYLLLITALLAPFVLVAALAARAHRQGRLRWHLHQFRVGAPLVGWLSDDDADTRRANHDLDAVRTRFEKHPVWPDSGVRGERR